ncbi:MAG: Gfo/Idh/MocA family oxidoreductase [Chthonomonadales bacterium]
MSKSYNRREFLNTSIAAGLAVAVPANAYAKPQSANDKLNIAVIGTANQARFSIANVQSQNIVAVCDIDENYLAVAQKDFPAAMAFTDYRKMLELKNIDAVVIATPDHAHAPATILALDSGRHVYCEKPLTHTLYEARQVAELARKKKRVTQMGTQIHAGDNYRRVVEIIQSGAIGDIKEVHCWVGTTWSGKGRPVETPPVPANMHWDLWLNVAPDRPYNPTYHPARWRGWWDFGGGAMSDMACHHMDLPTWALDLQYPTSVEAEGPELNAECAPEWLIVHYEYPSRGKLPPVKLTWYNGGKRPSYFAEGKLPNWGDGTLFVGSKGMMLAGYGNYKLLPETDFAGYVPPAPTIANSIGHHAEWIEACKHGGPTTCNFDYSGRLTETVLLGNVSFRTGKKIEWDHKKMRAKGCPEADVFLKPNYRKEWVNKIG